MKIASDRPLALFDMDGTLLESMQYWRGVSLEIAREQGFEISAEIEAQLRRHSSREGVRLLKEIAQMEVQLTPEMVWEKMLFHYENHVVVRPGVLELLRRVREEGAFMVVASASPRRLCEAALGKHGLLPFFDEIVTEENFGCGKGNPAFFHGVMEMFGASPDQITLYEDAYYSAKTAHGLGISVVATEDAYQAEHKEQLLELADAYYTEGFCRRLK